MVTLTATNMTYRIMSMSSLVIFILDMTIIITHVYTWLCSNIIELVVPNTDVYKLASYIRSCIYLYVAVYKV